MVRAGGGRASVEILDSDRGKDGLLGPVRRVRTEVARVDAGTTAALEGPRSLLEVTVYDIGGKRIANQTHPVAGGDAVAGRETYEYDERGRLLATVVNDEAGAFLARTVYSYQYDAAGNWVKITASVVVSEAGAEKLEPVEVTYRAITYYSGGASDRQPTAAGDAEQPDPVFDAGLINEQALSLPRPAYLVGSRAQPSPVVVTVEVVVDETGRVISARGRQGPRALWAAAESAARRAGFFPFREGRRPVKARGLLKYTFPFDPR